MIQTGRSAGLDVSTIPRIVGWARPLSKVPATYCGVVSRDDAIKTACRGSWDPVVDPSHYIDGRDRDRDADGRSFAKCGGCDLVAREQRTLEGLGELKHAPMIETRPFPDVAFVVVDNMSPALETARLCLERYEFDISDVDSFDLGGEA